MCRLQLAEGFPEPIASVVELLNNFTGPSERSFKVATWPGQHSRAQQQALLGLYAHTHTRAQTSLNPPAADRDKSVQGDKSEHVCRGGG